MSCGTFCAAIAKYLLFIFNLIVLIFAVLLIIFGSLRISKIDTYGGNSVAIAALSFAVLLCIVAFMGCCGAITENSCLLLTYAGILLVIGVLQIILAIWFFVSVSTGAFDNLDDELYDSFNSKDTSAVKSFRNMERLSKCCGVKGPSDYKSGLPGSCCGEDADKACSESKSYKIGCNGPAVDAVKNNSNSTCSIFLISGIVGVAMAIVVFWTRRKLMKSQQA